ncbi:unnamed protein product [Blepharisma stoltei]|uniref:Ribosomal protein L27 n=1 Tax=Blepharisma stoltei TaxID=1481888 RepID=A0AAU9JSQ8_9CILI|nr:unnamed protein product [Blepharisma stoltei]
MLLRASSKVSCLMTFPVRWATKLSGGVTKNTKDSPGNYLGIKKFGGEAVGYNKIIVRQRGFKWRPGANVIIGKDHTIHSGVEGYVHHEFNPERKQTVVSVVPWKLPEKKKLAPVFCYHPELYPELAANNPAPTNYVIKTKPKVEKVKKDVGKPLDEPKYLDKIEIDWSKADEKTEVKLEVKEKSKKKKKKEKE